MTTKISNVETNTPDFNEKHEVARLLDKHAFLPRFSHQLERLFLLSYAHHHRARMRVTLAIGLVLYLLAGIVDMHLEIAARNNLWLLRYLLITPLIAAALGAAFWVKRDAALQVIYAVAVVAAGAGAGLAIFLYPQTAVYSYTLSLFVILFYIYVISGMRIGYGLSCALLVTGVYLAGAFLSQKFSDVTFSMLIAQLAVVNLVGMYAGYRLEKEARRSFLHGRMVRLLNNEIVELAGVDELTGLANRRRMDEFYANTWARAQRDKTELTLLLVDVDYLQLLNDHLGRHIGDICLRKLGAVIQHYRKRPGDLAAHHEGGKFLVVLYACGERHGRTIAERLRQDIESLNLMNPASPAGWTVTVSIGVHTVVPTRNQSPASGLLSADTLLYMAKKRGHNCVVSDKDVALGNAAAIEEDTSRSDKTQLLPRSEAAGSP
ncbi:MAG TPA: GGDEF domain-containing protein [Gammaproteobacteria bacterium]|nr:GGDEF domain-containing protein [Gammaproteobacteria bacterium]